MTDEFNKWINGLNKEHELKTSWLGRFSLSIMFHLGFSRCTYCTYCNFNVHKYRGMQESVVLTGGKCHWSNHSSSTLNLEDLRQYHRCPRFIPVLFNSNNYCIGPREEELIQKRRLSVFITWTGCMIALLIALLSSLLK